MGVNMTMTLNPNGIGIQGRPGMGGLTPGMAAIGGQPNPGMGIMAMMAAAAPPPPIGKLVEIFFHCICKKRERTITRTINM